MAGRFAIDMQRRAVIENRDSDSRPERQHQQPPADSPRFEKVERGCMRIVAKLRRSIEVQIECLRHEPIDRNPLNSRNINGKCDLALSGIEQPRRAQADRVDATGASIHGGANRRTQLVTVRPAVEAALAGPEAAAVFQGSGFHGCPADIDSELDHAGTC